MEHNIFRNKKQNRNILKATLFQNWKTNERLKKQKTRFVWNLNFWKCKKIFVLQRLKNRLASWKWSGAE